MTKNGPYWFALLDSDGGGEVVDASYSRQPVEIVNASTNVVVNKDAINFPILTLSHTIIGIAIFDAQEGGRLLLSGLLIRGPTHVVTGDRISFPIGTFTYTIEDGTMPVPPLPRRTAWEHLLDE